jgi:hypothetical protein
MLSGGLGLTWQYGLEPLVKGNGLLPLIKGSV